MKQHRLSTKAVTLFIAIIGVLLLVPCMAAAGQLQPSAPPGPTMKTLDEIPPTWSQKLPADKRFVIVLDGAAVLDKETGLVWEKSPDTTSRIWNEAVNYCYTKTVGGRKGWRLPTIAELASLVDTTQSNPALPGGHPFVNVQPGSYWSSTEYVAVPSTAWLVTMGDGYVGYGAKSSIYSVWAVRGGQ